MPGLDQPVERLDRGPGLGADVGVDGETNVSTDYAQGDNAFTGKINRVTINVN